MFSDDVVAAGDSLYRNLLSVREFTAKTEEFSEELRQSELTDLLNKFETAWVTYEQYYVYELMVIESDARRFIIEAIELERKLTDIENTLSQIDCNIANNVRYNETRQALVEKLSQINSVANINGSGRDDLTDLGIL